jgi:hypothetical protein
VYQNETDINDPEYVDGYTNIVEEHYSAFQAQSKVANEFLRRQEMAVKDSYQTAGVNYQIKGLMREDNERIRTYLNETIAIMFLYNISITVYILRVVNISLILIYSYLLCQIWLTQ